MIKYDIFKRQFYHKIILESYIDYGYRFDIGLYDKKAVFIFGDRQLNYLIRSYFNFIDIYTRHYDYFNSFVNTTDISFKTSQIFIDKFCNEHMYGYEDGFTEIYCDGCESYKYGNKECDMLTLLSNYNETYDTRIIPNFTTFVIFSMTSKLYSGKDKCRKITNKLIEEVKKELPIFKFMIIRSGKLIARRVYEHYLYSPITGKIYKEAQMEFETNRKTNKRKRDK